MNREITSSRRDLEYPKIRPVEAIPLPDAGPNNIGLRDPRGIAQNILILPPAVFFMISLLDGMHSLRDIQKLFLRQYGELIPIQKIEEIVRQLDHELYLDSELFRQNRQEVLNHFRSSPIREAAFAGIAYAGDSQNLKIQLDTLLDSIRNQSPVDRPLAEGDLTLLIAPHIDLHRGGPCFAYAYRELAQHRPADLYLVFGTGHHSEHSLMTLTRKSFSTPLGTIETDTDFIDRYCHDLPVDLFEEELLHRDEHSIEFQMVWLRHVLGNEWKGKAVPILCGSFHSYIMNGQSPREDPRVAHLLDRLRETIDQYPGRVATIAGVDLSHVGQRFGHSKGIPAAELDRVRREDQEVLDAIRTGDPEVFFRTIEKKKDRNNICGLSPIYVALDVMRQQPGYLLHYDRAIEEDTQSVVTYASFAFYH